ncbi:hypothetical protein AVEN_84854-1, partial [Araneus ventricosus]
IFSRCMLVLGPEPGQEGRLWATSRSRVPVDCAAIASDVRESSCREEKIQLILHSLSTQLSKSCSLQDFRKCFAVNLEILKYLNNFDEHLAFPAFLAVLLTMINLFRSGYQLAFPPVVSTRYNFFSSATAIFYLTFQLLIMISAAVTNEEASKTTSVILDKKCSTRSEKARLEKRLKESNLTLWKIYVLDRSIIISSIGSLLTYGILLGTFGKVDP